MTVQSGLKVGGKVYGDRDITALSVPDNLANVEFIRTACDSKMYTGQLASFKADKDIAVYAAVDTRVNAKLDWLKSWIDTGSAIVTSNDVQLELFRTTAKSGETVILGTNGGENESANYIVFAVLLENDKAPAGDIKWGDANCDNTVTTLTSLPMCICHTVMTRTSSTTSCI